MNCKLAGFLVISLAWLARADSAGDLLFLEKVKPLLEARCVSCHGPEKAKGGLRLDSRDASIRGGENGPAIVPGRSSLSLLLQAVMHSKKDLEMPPKEKLTSNDIALLERWIDAGAPWPENPGARTETFPSPSPKHIGNAWSDQRNPIAQLFGGQRLDLWSLQPISRPNPPRPKNKKWSRNAIDDFILTNLEAMHLSPAREASKRELARRLYFDLTGLPPTPDELDAFLRDESPVAYEHLVDRLLNSQRYGEHQARMWLDVVRYSDSNGFDWDEFRPRAWRFRDYVIRSFNADKPFDQFIREQLAGDELFDGPPESAAERDALIGTGYLRLGPQDNSAAAFNEQDRSRSELLADLAETTASAFLGLTLSCCRCHDHKYDPLSQADHYRIRAFFEPVTFADDLPLDSASERAAIRAHNQTVDQKLKPWQDERDSIFGSVQARLRQERVATLPEEERVLLAMPLEKAGKDLKQKIDAIEKKLQLKEKEVIAALSVSEKSKYDQLAKQIETVKRERRDFTLGLLMTDGTNPVPSTKVLFQGNHKQPRHAVPPGFISVLDPDPAQITRGPNGKTTGRRFTLANWISSTNNPLTARVLVNRIWQEDFGYGLVATANDFGLAGSGPSNPKLLDWLAVRFMRDGWSIKKLHRLILTSATYRQSSMEGQKRRDRSRIAAAKQADPNNLLLWKQNPRRLSAEQLRDSLLFVSGLLNLERGGGPPVWPELPPEVLQANPAFLDDNETKTKGWYPSPKPDQNVRSIYLVQKRTVRVPFLEAFDLPENSTSCARRLESIVAPQALSLLNGTLSLAAAEALARRITSEARNGPDAKVERAFSLILQRPPSRDERRRCATLLHERNLTELCRALLNINEFIYID